jgi:hypothetical protein
LNQNKSKNEIYFNVSYKQDVTPENAKADSADVVILKDTVPEQTIHIILEVVDSGIPHWHVTTE